METADVARSYADWLAELCDSTGRWRRETAERFPDDHRNLRCAEALEQAARYVRTLESPTDSRAIGWFVGLAGEFDEWGRPSEPEIVVSPVNTGSALSRFHFDNSSGEPTALDFERLLEETFAETLDSWREHIEESDDQPPRSLMEFLDDHDVPLWEGEDEDASGARTEYMPGTFTIPAEAAAAAFRLPPELLSGLATQAEAFRQLLNRITMPPQQVEMIRAAVRQADLAAARMTQLAAPFAAVIERVTEHAAAMAKVIGPALQHVQIAWENSLPANWRDLEFEDVKRILERVDTTDVCLVWAPGPDLLRVVIDSAPEDTVATLLKERERLADDLASCIGEMAGDVYPDIAAATRTAIRAFREERDFEAQCVAALVFTDLIHVGLGMKTRAAKVQYSYGGNWEKRPLTLVRWATIWVAGAKALETWWPTSGKPVPVSYTRHASLHTTSAVQYTSGNAVRALLLAVGLLRELAFLSEKQAADDVEAA